MKITKAAASEQITFVNQDDTDKKEHWYALFGQKRQDTCATRQKLLFEDGNCTSLVLPHFPVYVTLYGMFSTRIMHVGLLKRDDELDYDEQDLVEV